MKICVICRLIITVTSPERSVASIYRKLDCFIQRRTTKTLYKLCIIGRLTGGFPALQWQFCFSTVLKVQMPILFYSITYDLSVKETHGPFKTIDVIQKPSCIFIFCDLDNEHDDVIKWKHFPRYWPFVRGIHRWIPLTKASDAELWCFLRSAPE